MTTKAIPESDMLAPRDPARSTNSDDWPEFELKDVKVHIPGDPQDLTSLLDAAEHYPLTLIGYLEPLPKSQAHLQLQATARRAPLIEVSEVRTFSYGQFEDGNIGLWAGGKAGWFALKPARAYRPIWINMVASVNIFYWVVDAYREKRRKGNYKSAPFMPDYTAEEVFEKYEAEMMDESSQEAARLFYEHKDFLLASMLAGKEGINWSKNPLYVHLSHRFPEEHATIKARLTGSAAPAPARNSRQPSVNSENGVLKRKRGRPVKDRSQDVASARESSQQQASRPTASRRTRRGQTESSNTDTTEHEVNTPRAMQSDDDEPQHRSMKGRSALRPKATKAGKGASKGGKAPVHGFMDDDDSDSSLPSPVPAKRRSSHTNVQDQNKRKGNRTDIDEGIDMPSSPASNEHGSTPSDTGPGAADNDSDDEHAPDTDLALRLKHEPDPIQEDTWVCGLDGCLHKVYQTSTAESQRLIREHYVLHAHDDDERVQLVKKLQHPSLPVGHLMERVRLQARTDGFPGSRSSALEGANAHSRYRPLPQVRY